jgi:hypothetical protein
MSEEALKHVLKQEMFKQVVIKNIQLKSKSFDLFKLEWSFELSANIEEIWGTFDVYSVRPNQYSISLY